MCLAVSPREPRGEEEMRLLCHKHSGGCSCWPCAAGANRCLFLQKPDATSRKASELRFNGFWQQSSSETARGKLASRTSDIHNPINGRRRYHTTPGLGSWSITPCSTLRDAVPCGAALVEGVRCLMEHIPVTELYIRTAPLQKMFFLSSDVDVLFLCSYPTKRLS